MFHPQVIRHKETRAKLKMVFKTHHIRLSNIFYGKFMICSINLTQFKVFFIIVQPTGRTTMAVSFFSLHQSRGGDPVPIATSGDRPPPSSNATLPDVLRLDDGTSMRLLRKPRALDWSPRNDYALLLLFKVLNLKRKGTIFFLFPSF